MKEPAYHHKIFTKYSLKSSQNYFQLQALVKEPALSDGRLQPGDKLLAANGVELASFSHQEVISMVTVTVTIVSMLVMMMMTMVTNMFLAASKAELASFSHQGEIIFMVIIMMTNGDLQVVQFLRQCPDTVSLELYRDASRSQTPLSPEQVFFECLFRTLFPVCSFIGRKVAKTNLVCFL